MAQRKYWNLSFKTDQGKTRSLTVNDLKEGVGETTLGTMMNRIATCGALDGDAGTVASCTKALEITEDRELFVFA